MRAIDAPNTYVSRFKRFKILSGRGFYDENKRLFQGHAMYKTCDDLYNEFCTGDDNFEFLISIEPEMR